MTICRDCDDAQREIANMADEIAFWAYHAKWHYAASHGMGRYDDLPRLQQQQIEEAFRQAKIDENRERLGHVSDSYDIGS